LRERAYPALLRAAKQADTEVLRRAEELLAKLRETVPPERLEVRDHDVIHTEDSRIAGRISTSAFKVDTFQFGEQRMKLTDVRELRSLAGATAEQLANALPDPGNLDAAQLQNRVGETFTFKVTGAQALPGGPQAALAMRRAQAQAALGVPGVPAAGGPGGRGGMAIPGIGGALWGSDVYTTGSSLALAAVHAGALRPGQTGAVRVRVLGPQNGFAGTTRNGVTSAPWGAYTGYRIIR
jgi:hypothetical protein